MAEAGLADVLRQIDRQLLAVTEPTREVADAGGFRLLLDPSTRLVWMNYAVPLATHAHDAPSLVQAFRERDRMPRLEFRRELWPDLEVRLVQAGFELEAEQPMMTCDRDSFVPVFRNGVEACLLQPEGDLEGFCRAADAAFGGTDPVSQERIDKLRGNLRNGNWICALATVSDEAAGCATITPWGGICELAGVGTVPAFRRMGIASTLSSLLLAKHFEDGTLAWLSAGDDTAKAVYERLGFRTAATQVNYILKD